MEKDTQRIIFILPEDITSTQIITDILNNNGITNLSDDIGNKNITPRIVTVNRATKDFFDKKITEEKMSELFQKELGVTKEKSTNIINNLKEKLIPFAKKITIPSDTIQVATPGNFDGDMKFESPIGVEDAIKNSNVVMDTQKNVDVPISTKPKVKKVSEIKVEPKIDTKQRKGPDTYREPIE